MMPDDLKSHMRARVFWPLANAHLSEWPELQREADKLAREFEKFSAVASFVHTSAAGGNGGRILTRLFPNPGLSFRLLANTAKNISVGARYRILSGEKRKNSVPFTLDEIYAVDDTGLALRALFVCAKNIALNNKHRSDPEVEVLMSLAIDQMPLRFNEAAALETAKAYDRALGDDEARGLLISLIQRARHSPPLAP
jgi:hypothetical protein